MCKACVTYSVTYDDQDDDDYDDDDCYGNAGDGDDVLLLFFKTLNRWKIWLCTALHLQVRPTCIPESQPPLRWSTMVTMRQPCGQDQVTCASQRTMPPVNQIGSWLTSAMSQRLSTSLLQGGLIVVVSGKRFLLIVTIIWSSRKILEIYHLSEVKA